MQETFTIDQYIRFLSLAPTDLLEQVGNGLITTFKHLSDEHHPDAKGVAMMLMMLGREHDLRQVEPLWRKARRFAIRNSETFKEIGKVAACVGAGALLGVSLDNS
ncbi:MAG: hypothetical protein JW955_19910 [Sedimentisphaerales bacterium]|nr:hypothetical protein [Sedimentisphaerales bacterium]